MTPELRRRHRHGKRRLRRQLVEERTQRERRAAELLIERQWARAYGMGLQQAPEEDGAANPQDDPGEGSGETIGPGGVFVEQDVGLGITGAPSP